LNTRKTQKKETCNFFKKEKTNPWKKQKRDYTPKLGLRGKGLKTETMGKCTNMKR
jgi:hypothetical protein